MKKAIITLFLAGSIPAGAQNLVVNGDFSAGNTGFTTEYTQSCSDLVPEGTYCVMSNPNSAHPSFSPCGDHTTGTGLMMVVNGAVSNSVTNPSQPKTVWSQMVTVTPGQVYNFTLFGQSVFPASPAHLTLSITGYIGATPATTFTSATNILSGTTCVPQQICFGFNSANFTSAMLRIVDENQDANGNDFAIDDIRFYTISPTATPCSLPTLPVTFTYINAGTDNHKNAVIQWNVATETNVQNYTIEKSTDGKSFTAIGQVDASRNDAREKTYFYTDYQFSTQAAYYRIRENDIDGKNVYSAVAVLRQDVSAQTGVSVFPNPATGSFTYTIKGNDGDQYSVKLIGLDGRVAYSENVTLAGGTCNKSVAADAMPKGIYLLRAENTQTKSVISDRMEIR